MYSDNTYIVQCLLARSARYRVAWIHEDDAFIGNFVELKDDDIRLGGWRVVSAGVRKRMSSSRMDGTRLHTDNCLGYACMPS